MSCISSNFSSFFLNSLNDPSEFAKYLSNGELKFSSFEDFQAFGTGAPPSQTQQQPQQYSSHPQQQQQQQLNGSSLYYHSNNGGSNTISSVAATNGTASVGIALTAGATPPSGDIFNGGGLHIEPNSYTTPHAALHHTQQQQQQQSAHTHTHAHQSLHHQQPQQQQHHHHPPHAHHPPLFGHNAAGQQAQSPNSAGAAFHHHSSHHTLPTGPTSNAQQQTPYPAQRPWPPGSGGGSGMHNNHPGGGGAQHFDGSFEFLKYLRHSNEYSDAAAAAAAAAGATVGNTSAVGVNGDATTANNASGGVNPILTQQQQQQQQAASLIDLDSSTAHKSRSSRKAAALLSSVSRASNSLDASALDVFDHDSKHTIFDLHHMTNSSNSNESSVEISNLAFPNSHLNASNSNTSSEGAAAGSSDFSLMNSANSAPKPLATFTIKENFEVHPSHKVEEGIFQHMNKLPPKKKENLKQLGVRFTGQMTLADKSIIVENFIKFCQEYDIKDHRPFLSLNQSGLNKPEQIKFARFLGQGLPTFTLFCIYSNFKNLFCTKRTEIYTKDGYNLPYILDKTKRFLSNTTADLKNMVHQQSNDGLDFASNNNTCMANAELTKCIVPKVLENFMIYENFEVPETHRVEDGVCTHITRLPPKKQEILKQFGIQSNQTVTYYEKYIVVENFIKFCNEYKVTDHRPFLDFHESGLPKCEQLKFVRYLGQGLPNLTLNKIYLAFKDVLGLNRIEKITIDGYSLDMILKKKKKNLYNRMHAAVPI